MKNVLCFKNSKYYELYIDLPMDYNLKKNKINNNEKNKLN